MYVSCYHFGRLSSLCLKVSHTDILSCYKWREWLCSSLVVVDTLDFLSLGETASDFIPRPVFIPDDHWEVRLLLAGKQCLLWVGSCHRCLLERILHRLNLTFNESVGLREMWTGRYMVKVPLGGEVSKRLTGIMTTIIAHNSVGRSIFSKHLTHLVYDSVTRHLPLDEVHKRKLRLVVTYE